MHKKMKFISNEAAASQVHLHSFQPLECFEEKIELTVQICPQTDFLSVALQLLIGYRYTN